MDSRGGIEYLRGFSSAIKQASNMGAFKPGFNPQRLKFGVKTIEHPSLESTEVSTAAAPSASNSAIDASSSTAALMLDDWDELWPEESEWMGDMLAVAKKLINQQAEDVSEE